MDVSPRRVLLSTALVLLCLTDASVVYRMIRDISIGHEFNALGVRGLGTSLALLQLPLFVGFFWVTRAVWRALRD